ncbi:IS3 family transposase [Paenibacillus sambharensis]|uniref:IS3 family transposase n=1 Tax=Paenibacillus sambharensis TaxID=1803190 RepID=UPI002482FC22|nr:IS3 family transposase [Paenibacillus sambharensis]
MPAALVLRILGIAESTYYDRKKREMSCPPERPAENRRGRPVPGYSHTFDGERVVDSQINDWLLELIEGEEHVYGYKLLAQCIRDKYNVRLDKKKAYRLCNELGILQKPRQRVQAHPRRLPKNRVVTGSNQLWQMDIKYGYVRGLERFFYVLSIIDVFDRVVVQQYRGTSCEAKHAVQTLCYALQSRLRPGDEMPTIRTDNGPQFVSKLFGDMCESLGVIHERIPPRTPNMNAYIESFHSLLERDLFSKRDFRTFKDAYEELDGYMDFYNNRRMHGSLKRKPPAVFSAWVQTLEDSSAFHKAM